MMLNQTPERSNRATFSLPVDLIKRVRLYADRTGLKFSAVVRLALIQFLDANPK